MLSHWTSCVGTLANFLKFLLLNFRAFLIHFIGINFERLIKIRRKATDAVCNVNTDTIWVQNYKSYSITSERLVFVRAFFFNFFSNMVSRMRYFLPWLHPLSLFYNVLFISCFLLFIFYFFLLCNCFIGNCISCFFSKFINFYLRQHKSKNRIRNKKTRCKK